MTVVCQTTGERVGAGQGTDYLSNIWNKLANGAYVADLFLDTRKDVLVAGLPKGLGTPEMFDSDLPDCSTGLKRERIPTLGADWAPSQQGYGEVRPTIVFNGGSASGMIRDITWDSWGGAQAVGHGTGVYYGSTDPVFGGEPRPITIVAYNLGTCPESSTGMKGGYPAYRSIQSYFAGEGEKFDPAAQVQDICAGY